MDSTEMNHVCRAVLSKYRDLADNVQPFNYDFSSTFERVVKKLKITHFHFHDLRHTFASSLAMSGIDLNTVRELLRHKSLRDDSAICLSFPQLLSSVWTVIGHQTKN